MAHLTSVIVGCYVLLATVFPSVAGATASKITGTLLDTLGAGLPLAAIALIGWGIAGLREVDLCESKLAGVVLLWLALTITIGAGHYAAMVDVALALHLGAVGRSMLLQLAIVTGLYLLGINWRYLTDALARPPAPVEPAPIEVSEPAPAPADYAPASTAEPATRDDGLPPMSLLDEREYYTGRQDVQAQSTAIAIERAFAHYGVNVQVVGVHSGPTITLYELQLPVGSKSAAILRIQDDLGRELASRGKIRIVERIAGRSTVGVEMPNAIRAKVRLSEMLNSPSLGSRRWSLPVLLGRGSNGVHVVADLAAMPHLLIAGSTGNGKSVAIHSLLTSVLMLHRPDRVKLLLVDPKMVELSAYDRLPHLLAPVVVNPARVALLLDWAIATMESRYKLLQSVQANSIDRYNLLTVDERQQRCNGVVELPESLPHVIIVVEEFADVMLTAGKIIETSIARLAQKARAVGIHLIVATQSPRATVLTGLIKSNLQARLAFRVPESLDSRIILDSNGAERLIGDGDALFQPPDGRQPIRVQGTYTSPDEVERVTNWVKEHNPPVEYSPETAELASDDEQTESPLYTEACSIVVETHNATVRHLASKLQIGVPQAHKLLQQMEVDGIVTATERGKPRRVVGDNTGQGE